MTDRASSNSLRVIDEVIDELLLQLLLFYYLSTVNHDLIQLMTVSGVTVEDTEKAHVRINV